MSNRLAHQTILDFQLGDGKAFERVFKSYYRSIAVFATKLTGSRDEGEDIATEVFLSLFKRHNLFKDEQNIKAFLYLCARNSSLNYLKARQREGERLKEFAERMEDDTMLEYEYSIKTEIVAAIYNAIENLPEECRRIFKMLYVEKLKPAEVAAVLQISVNTVYVQKSRAVNTLRLKLSENSLAIAWLLHTIALLQIDILYPTHTIHI
jgi:RNA polymerase sigma-70 factor (ECF subfamily)